MEEKGGICVKAKLVAKRDGMYTTYVFQIEFGEYVYCTRLPNWNGKDVNIGQEGFLSYRFVQAGTDKWYNQQRCVFEPYLYTANYFIDFVPLSHIIDKDRVVEIDTLFIK